MANRLTLPAGASRRARAAHGVRGGQVLNPGPPPPATAWGDDEVVADEPPVAFIFHCNSDTEAECLDNDILATRDNTTNRIKLACIGTDTKLYLYNFQSRRVHGPFSRRGDAGNHLPELFGGEFQLQLRVAREATFCSRHARQSLRFGPHSADVSLRNLTTEANDFSTQPTSSVVPEEPARARDATPPVVEAPAVVAPVVAARPTDVCLLELQTCEDVERNGFEPCFELHSFLQKLELQRFAAKFDHAEVRFSLLRTLSERDLQSEIGLPFGPAREIVNALEETTSGSASSDLSSSSIRLLTDGSF